MNDQTSKYSKLDKSETYDQETVEQLAEAMTELRAMEKRAEYLRELIDENKELHQFIWGTADGKLIPHHKIEDDHFKNIVSHLVAGNRVPSKALRAEARRRNIDVPSDSDVLARRYMLAANLIDADDFDDVN